MLLIEKEDRNFEAINLNKSFNGNIHKDMFYNYSYYFFT